MTRTPSLLLAFVLILAAATGCTKPGKDAPGPTTTTGATAPSTSTTEATVTSVTSATSTPGPGEVNIPDTTGEDFVKIVGGLNELLNEISKKPDHTEILDLVFEPSGTARKATELQIANLRSKGWRYSDSGATASQISLQRRPTSDAALVQLVTEQGPQIVVDGTGAIVQRGDGWKPRREQYTLKRGTDGRWRIVTMTLNGPA